MPFIAITEKASTELVSADYAVLRRGMEIHKRLERLVLEERGLQELVDALSQALRAPVAVLDAARFRAGGVRRRSPRSPPPSSSRSSRAAPAARRPGWWPPPEAGTPMTSSG